jgi:hypothetical protein
MDSEPVAWLDASRSTCPGGKLQHRARPPAALGSPRRHVLRGSQHSEPAVEKDDVDRKAHEPGVHGASRAQQQAVSEGESRLTE